MTDHTFETSPRLKARIAGVFYLLTFLTRGVALFVRGRLSLVAGLIAGACYIAVTLLFYHIFKPVNRHLSLLAASFSKRKTKLISSYAWSDWRRSPMCIRIISRVEWPSGRPLPGR